jgi:alcohol dehydrogenase, propanol-preferring
MKAAVFVGVGKPLEIQEWPKPSAGAGEIVVKVAACGVCHTDLHYVDHGVPTVKKTPMVLGHEASGLVSEVGSGVTKWKVGDRVLLPAVLTCGICPNCRTGRENICDTMVMFGNHIDGAYAEFVKSPAKDAIALPPENELPIIESSIIADAVSTPFHAVKNRAQVRPGDTVVVYGCGGVGINAVQLSAAAGATVIAIDINSEKLEWARSFGATYCLNPKEEERIDKKVRQLTGGGADIAIEVIGNPNTMADAFNTLRKGGRLVIVGYTDKKMDLAAPKMMFFEMEVVGSLGCRPADYPRIVEMARTKKIRIKELVTAKFKLEDINKALDLLREGKGLRSVVTP